MNKLENWTKLVRDLDPKIFSDEAVRERIFKKIESGKITRDEDPLSHFVVYFLPYNPLTKKVYLVYVEKVGGGFGCFREAMSIKGKVPKRL